MRVQKISFIPNIYLKESHCIEFEQSYNLYVLLFGKRARVFLENDVWFYELIEGRKEEIKQAGLISFLKSKKTLANISA